MRYDDGIVGYDLEEMKDNWRKISRENIVASLCAMCELVDDPDL